MDRRESSSTTTTSGPSADESSAADLALPASNNNNNNNKMKTKHDLIVTMESDCDRVKMKKTTGRGNSNLTRLSMFLFPF